MGAIQADVQVVLSHRHDNGADFWATPDGRIYVGTPLSTISSLGILHELGTGVDHEAVEGGLGLLLDACRDDGRIRVAPKAPLYPCYTAEAARTLCRFGLTGHEAVQRTISYIFEAAHDSGGWRCNFSRFGHGPETECASPGATLYALDVLRFFPEHVRGSHIVDRAAESLLDHWEVRSRVGPCHHGIGSLFLQVEYPFLRYNLFFYVYVLSFYDRAKSDPRFLAALALLRSKLNGDGQVVVERPHRGLKELELCAKGQPSELATRRYLELCQNLA